MGTLRGAFFPAILLGIVSKRMNEQGAIVGRLVGLGFTAGYIVWFEFRSPETNDAAHRWFGISPEGIGTMGMLLDFAVAIAVAALTPPPSQRVQQLVEDIRVPRAARSAAALDAE